MAKTERRGFLRSLLALPVTALVGRAEKPEPEKSEPEPKRYRIEVVMTSDNPTVPGWTRSMHSRSYTFQAKD